MNDVPALSFLIIAITCVVSYQGFKSLAFEQKYLFHTEAILSGKEYSRLVTSAFLHANWQHLIFNMMSLYFFGRHLELILGKAQFMAIYFGAIAGGSLLSLYVHRHHAYTAYGASGGVCGVIFAYILLFPGGGVQMFYLPLSVPGWLYAIGYILYSFLGMKEHRDNIGHDAHLGGAIIGFLIAAGLNPEAVVNNLLVFFIVLVSTILLLVYLWSNPLFLPISKFLGGRLRWREKAVPGRPAKHETLPVDVVLDKIARSGFESLTTEEKEVLAEASNRYRRRADSKRPESGLAI
jgi:membrane associated rhomboid family serine protease